MRYFIIMMSMAFFTLAFTGCRGDDKPSGSGTGGEVAAAPDDNTGSGAGTAGTAGTAADFDTVTLGTGLSSPPARVEVSFNNGVVVDSVHLIKEGDCVKAPAGSISHINHIVTNFNGWWSPSSNGRLCGSGSNSATCSGSYEVVAAADNSVVLNSAGSDAVDNCIDVSVFYTVTSKSHRTIKIKDKEEELVTLSILDSCVKILTVENTDGSKQWWGIEKLDFVDENNNGLCKDGEGGCSVDNYAITAQTTGPNSQVLVLESEQKANDGQQCVWLKSPTP